MLQVNNLLRTTVVQLFSRDDRLNDHYEISPQRVNLYKTLFFIKYLLHNNI